MPKCSAKCAFPPRLIHRVTIERPSYTQDAHGEQIETWSTYGTRRAICRAMTAREVVQAEQVQGAIGWIIKMPRDSTTIAITSNMRMTLHSFGDRTVYCDGPAMPDNEWSKFVQLRAIEQTT